MDFDEFYRARDDIDTILRKDLLGPVTDDEIICNDFPTDYYITGKLYPQGSDITAETESRSDDIGTLDSEDIISMSNGNKPSACGLSFLLNANAVSFAITINAAQYHLISKKEAQESLNFSDDEYQEDEPFWKRIPLKEWKYIISVENISQNHSLCQHITDGLDINVILHKEYSDGSRVVTVSLLNTMHSRHSRREDNQISFFQPEIHISSDNKTAFGDVRRNVYLNKDAEIVELEMLYSDVKTFGAGHGCACRWEVDSEGECTDIYTEFLPQYELCQMMPSRDYHGKILSMKFLSSSTLTEVQEGIKDFLKAYRQWISAREKEIPNLKSQYIESATSNIVKCKDALNLLQKSILALNDKVVFEAFQYANKAMFYQRKQTLQNEGETVKDQNITWYPFQLAFFLQEIPAISDINSPEHEKVDLLWFPTGGGKTEAYLGIAAFTIFLRRLRNGNNGDGVTVLMRYTLRLLSFQQFERASALICACELIRKEQHIPGGEIGIGLWAGRALTPNKLEAAQKILNGETDTDFPSSNPQQLKKCPWCHGSLDANNYSVDTAHIKMHIRCSNPSCKFCHGLPIYLIDEEIYAHKPAFIIATVDKFAQVAVNEDTASIFGLDSGKIPPELIIQDELHLISGPLGTITGIYEAAITKLCEYNGHKPKIIASTATIRNAADQIKALYGKEYTQFPPQGISMDDSFFAVKSSRNGKPARLYMGCMAVGASSTTMMVRVTAALLYATRYLIGKNYSTEVIDSFWTLTVYFNSLRELGGAIIRVEDDIQDRFSLLRDTKFKNTFPLSDSCQKRYDRYKELTSREKSENIGNVIQNELQIPYTEDGSTAPYDILLASNMISVGIDIKRLGTMIVYGQPKSSSEYIQATSRVGRENPGIVISTYNQGRSRDRSHYEQFMPYHMALYKYVEATSVTPFADRARDRALQTLYVILCRYSIPELRRDEDAINYKKSLPGLEKVRQYIFNYVSIVDPDELDNVKNEIEDIENTWQRKADRRDELFYKNKKGRNKEAALFDEDYEEYSRFRVLNSMRSVETMVEVSTKDN